MKTLYLSRPVHRRFPISSTFGIRIHPVEKTEKHHNGYDFACPIGTPIMAMSDGKIKVVGYEDPQNHNKGYGLRVYQEIHQHEETYLLVYAHLSYVKVYEGQSASEYGLIGYSGNSGSSTGSHLHVGARVKDSSEWVQIQFKEDANFVVDIPKPNKETKENVA